MTSFLNGEVTYPRFPHGVELTEITHHQRQMKGLLFETPDTVLLIDKTFFIEDVEDHR